MCRADPPGWRQRKNAEPEWYAGGPNYNKPCVPVAGKDDGVVRESCAFCGRWLCTGNVRSPPKCQLDKLSGIW